MGKTNKDRRPQDTEERHHKPKQRVNHQKEKRLERALRTCDASLLEDLEDID